VLSPMWWWLGVQLCGPWASSVVRPRLARDHPGQRQEGHTTGTAPTAGGKTGPANILGGASLDWATRRVKRILLMGVRVVVV
jgi:hypothetical protein